MTDDDQEKIIRRIASATRFEYYQIEYTPQHMTNPAVFKKIVDNMEAKVAIIRNIIGEPLPETTKAKTKKAKNDKPDAPKEFKYWTEGHDIIFACPFPQKDDFKALVKDITKRWPTWIEERLLWKLDESLFTVKLQAEIIEGFMGGKE